MRVGFSILAVLGATSFILSDAGGAVIDNSTITIAGGTAAYPGYPQTDAIDTNPPDANYQTTDYASNGGGNSTYLDFAFAAAVTFTQITETDRVTSGAGNGSFVGGTSDFVTQYEYEFYTDNTFTTQIGSPVVVNRTAPVSPSTPADFTTATPIGNITSQFVRWQVLAGGTNSGASNFIFEVTPEPSSICLLALASFGSLARRRRA